jgi:hypothetical protein
LLEEQSYDLSINKICEDKPKNERNARGLDQVYSKYQNREIKCKSLLCQFCGERRVGGRSQLELHIERKHSKETF